MKHILQEWESFKKILPPDAPETWVRNMRRAFYAGVLSLYAMLLDSAARRSSEQPSEEDLRMMGEIEEELKEWVDDTAAQALETLRRNVQRQAGKN